jgi:cytoskeletal protein RodZ
MIGRRGSPSTDEAGKPKGFDDYDLRLGDLMRGERATLSKSLLDVQRELRIKASYIAAIENADPSAFETPGFVAGYVRSYARYLGLDPDWAFRRFCEESGFAVAHGMSAAASGPRTPRKIEYDEPLANPNASFVPRAESFLSGVQPGAIGSILVLVALSTGIGYGGYTVLQEVQRVQLAPLDTAPGVVADIDPLKSTGGGLPGLAVENAAEGATVALQPEDAAGEALDRLYRPEALEVPVLVERDGPIAAIDPGSVGVLPNTETATDAAVAAALEVAPLGSTPVQVVAEAAPGLELLAVRPSWVRVQAADGTVIFEKILDAGERYALPMSEEPPTLRVGESGSLYFAVNGQTYGPAGERGSVTKNLVLTPEVLTSTYALADLSRDEDLARFVDVAEVIPAPELPEAVSE